MATQPRACASVGASKLARNQSRTAGEKGASGSATAACDHGSRSVAPDGHFDQMFTRSHDDGPNAKTGHMARRGGRLAVPRALASGLNPKSTSPVALMGRSKIEREGRSDDQQAEFAAVLGGVAAVALFLIVNPWYAVDPKSTADQIVTVTFWVSFLALLVVLFEMRKDPGGETIEIEGPAFTRFLFSNSRAGLFWLPDPPLRRLHLPGGRLSQVQRHRLA